MSNNAKILITVLVIVVGILVFVNLRPGPDSVNEQYTVGVLLSTSGAADYIGKPESDVLRKIQERFGPDQSVNPRIRLIFMDTNTKSAQAEELFNELAANDDVVAIIGPSTSGESIPLASKAESVGIPLLSLAASKRIVVDEVDGRQVPRRWTFKFAQNDDLAAERLARAMIQLGHRRIALLNSADGFGKSGGEAFRNVVEESGRLVLRHHASFPKDLTEAGSYVSSIPADAQAVLVWGTAPGPALLVRALSQHRPDLQIYLSHGNASVDFIRSAGPPCEGAILVGSRVLLPPEELDLSNPSDAVIGKYQEFWAHNLPGAPSHFGGHAHDALEALAAVLSDGSSGSTRQGIRDGLEALKNFHGVTGTFTFSPKDHAGLGLDAFATYVIESGSFKKFSPSSNDQ